MFAMLRARLAQMLLPSGHMVVPVPRGYRLVPYQPTGKMLRAAAGAMHKEVRPTQSWVTNKRKHGIRYRAMLDAYDLKPTKQHRKMTGQ